MSGNITPLVIAKKMQEAFNVYASKVCGHLQKLAITSGAMFPDVGYFELFTQLHKFRLIYRLRGFSFYSESIQVFGLHLISGLHPD